MARRRPVRDRGPRRRRASTASSPTGGRASAGDLATFGGTLQALVVRGRPNFDANTANPGETYPVEWVTIDEPNPLTGHRPCGRRRPRARRSSTAPRASGRPTTASTSTAPPAARPARPVLGVHARGARRRRPEADLRVRRRARTSRTPTTSWSSRTPATSCCRRTRTASSSSAASRGGARSTTSPAPCSTAPSSAAAASAPTAGRSSSTSRAATAAPSGNDAHRRPHLRHLGAVRRKGRRLSRSPPAPERQQERPRNDESPATAGLSKSAERGLEPPPTKCGSGPQPCNPGVRSVLCVHIAQNVHESGRNGRSGRSGCCRGCCHGRFRCSDCVASAPHCRLARCESARGVWEDVRCCRG